MKNLSFKSCPKGVVSTLTLGLLALIALSGCSKTIIQLPHHSYFTYSGRVDFSDSLSPVFAYPGVSIRAKFTGTSLAVLLEEKGNGGPQGTNYFNVIVDHSEPYVIELTDQKNEYLISDQLTDTIHTVEIFKRTEARVGPVIFKGLKLHRKGQLLYLEDKFDLKMEFIGHSITCGYGNETLTDLSDVGFTSDQENNYQAWGAVAARQLNAEYMCTVYSGTGLIYNIDGTFRGTAPQFFNRTFPDSTYSRWDHAAYQPDIVVLNLGANDFNAEYLHKDLTIEKERFVQTYLNFMAQIRAKYPETKIICTVGVMMSDTFPPHTQSWTRIQDYVSTVVNRANQSGADGVFYLVLTPQKPPYGQDSHPSTATQQLMADQLVQFIQEKVNK